MKFDIKSILILLLLATSLLFGLKWLWSSDKKSKERVKQLEKEFALLEKNKKAVDTELAIWISKSDSLKLLDAKLQAELAKQEALTKKAEQEVKKSKADLNGLREDLSETKNKIKEIKNHPPNRTGDALLESLKNKTKN